MLSKEVRHLIYALSNSYKFNEYSYNNLNYNNELFFFDTESCQRIEGCNDSAKLYAWGFGCNKSHKMVYGENMDNFIDFILNYFDRYLIENPKELKIKKDKDKKYPTQKYITFTIGVHNLDWDCEFIKYWLVENGYTYNMAEIKRVCLGGAFSETARENEEPNTFHIVQNDNIIYNLSIYSDYLTEVTNKDGSITKIGLHLDFFDTYKIISTGVDNFNKYTNGVNKMFYKLKEQYDYDKFRKEGHILSNLELRYLYNDIYMLRETFEQFVINILFEGDIKKLKFHRTASSIAFSKLKDMTFGELELNDKTGEYEYKRANANYEAYYGIGQKTKYEPLRKRLENISYSGGYTHANHKYVTKHLKNVIGCSIDINSSYPSQMRNKLFPKGLPIKKTNGYIPKLEENQVSIIEVAFDYVEPKCNKFNLDIFKIGAENIKALSKLIGDVSGNEYFATNIFNNKVIDVFNDISSEALLSNYQMVLTSAELDFMLKHFRFGHYERNFFGVVTNKRLKFNGLEIGEGMIYEGEIGVNKDFVDYCMEGKVSAKLEGNNALANAFKLLANSSYGKYGTRTDRVEKNLIIDNEGIFKFTCDNAIEYTTKSFYKPYASFVTAYGRLQLWNSIIYAVGVDNFVYCDTDSIYCLRDKESLKNDMNAIGENIDKTEVGKWDIETEFKEIKVLGQKKYMYTAKKFDKETKEFIGWYTNVKCCGLPEKARESILKEKEPYKEFRLGKEIIGKKQKIKVIGGYLLLDVKFEIKKIAW